MAEGLHFDEKGIYRLVNGGLLLSVALFGGEGYLGVGVLTAALVLEAFGALLLLAGINFLGVRGKLLCLSAAGFALCGAVWRTGLGESMACLRAYVPWLLGWPGGERFVSLTFLHIIIIVILCYLLQILTEKIPRLKLVFAALLSAGAFFCLVTEKPLGHLGMAFGICYVATAWAEEIQRRWKKVRRGSGKAYMLRIMPFLAVYLLLMASMPAPAEPYGWEWAGNIYHQVSEMVRVISQNMKWGRREGFGLAFSGFSGEGALGEGLREEAGEVMAVRLRNGNLMNVYLTGAVYDTFTGREWRQEYQGDPEGMFLDAAETFCAAREFGGQYRGDYLREAELTLRYLDFGTEYMFAPLKTKQTKGGPDYTGQGGGLRFYRHQGYGTEYELRFWQMNGGQEAFDRFLEAGGAEAGTAGEPSPGDSAVLEEMRVRYGGDEAFNSRALDEHRRAIHEQYLQETELSPEAADYLARVTEGAVTDVEKLRAIEREFSSYIYTLTPGKLPEHISEEGAFLDYFLLESRRGYCTYFATAFVLLARAEGIPARYVEGYCVPIQGTEETLVTSNMAHAWPEAYLAGVGWIPFEPTPGYGEIRYTPWTLRQPDSSAERPSQEGEKEEKQEQEVRKEEAARESEEQDPQEEEGRRGSVWLPLTAFFGISAGYVLLIGLEGALRRRRYRNMGPGERFMTEVSRNLRILVLLGLKREPGETLQELRERGRLKEGLETSPEGLEMLCFLENYESVVYGGKVAGEDMAREAAAEREALLTLLRKEKWWAYVYCRMRY